MDSKLQTDDFKLSGFYRALVLDNDDPNQLGRIKVRVYGIFESGIPTAKLPWAVPARGVFTGSGSGYGNFAVPEVDSQVFVFFEGEDIYQPVYFAEAPNAVFGLPSERTAGYPFRKVLKTKNGVVIYIDDSSNNKEIKVSHPSGSHLTIDKDGKITIKGGDVTIEGAAVIIKGTTVEVNP